MTEFLRFCGGILFLIFVVWLLPREVRGWLAGLLLLCTLLALVGLATGYSPR